MGHRKRRVAKGMSFGLNLEESLGFTARQLCEDSGTIEHGQKDGASLGPEP